MDVFKILTRSTNLQKSAPSSKKVQQHKIPSSVGEYVESHPKDEHTATLHATENTQPRGTKRKRSEGDQHQVSEPSIGLDYFENMKGASSSVEKPAGSGEQASRIVNGNIDRNGPPATAAQTLEEDECRRILKRNKVKITLLKSDRSKESEKQPMSQDGKQAAQNKDTRPQLSPQPLLSFRQLRTNYGISRRLAENLDAQGFRHPTAVQIGSLPLLLGSDKDRGLAPSASNKKKKHKQSQIDLLTVAPTGSGKTLAFMVNILHGLLERRRRSRKSGAEKKEDHELQALVIAPTHELADQIVNEGRKLAVGTGIRVSSMRKGMKLHADPQALEEETIVGLADEINDVHGKQGSHSVVKADVLVSTPMILLNALIGDSSSPKTLLSTVRYLVLDEADVLLDPLFRSQTLGIWQACNNPKLQTSLWSATIGSSIESLAQDTILDRRRNLKLTSSSHFLLRVVVGLKDSAIPNISHRLTYAATEHGKLLALRQLLHPSAPSTDKTPSLQPPFLIFTQTIQRAIALHSELLYDIPSEAGGSSRIAVLHSDLSDYARSAIMAGFRKGEIWVLITTDLLSRGIDFRGMNGVVNYDIPNTGASYVHRVGRTGRQGREGGVAVTLYTKEDIPYVKNIANVIAASEKAKGKPPGSAEGAHNLQKWFLDALPSVSKKMKQELRRKGVESRRVFEGKEGGKMARRARISTKSGYDRRLQNRRKAASTEGTKSLHRESSGVEGASDGEWGGLNE